MIQQSVPDMTSHRVQRNLGVPDRAAPGPMLTPVLWKAPDTCSVHGLSVLLAVFHAFVMATASETHDPCG